MLLVFQLFEDARCVLLEAFEEIWKVVRPAKHTCVPNTPVHQTCTAQGRISCSQSC